jgi:alpha-N-arabinofuranosidase
VAVFALNRRLDEEMEVEISLNGFGQDRRIVAALHVSNPNFKAGNSKDEPNNVVPRPIDTVAVKNLTIIAKLPPGSWNVIVAAPA